MGEERFDLNSRLTWNHIVRPSNMAQQPTRRKSALSMKAEYYCSSEDEEEWQAEDPLISCVAFGWTEGRLHFTTKGRDTLFS